jgi:glycine C-acetyltransferase
MTIATRNPFRTRAESVLAGLRDSGQFKRLQMIEGPMGPVCTLRDHGDCLNFCSNNYLGLANHPEVVEAGISGLSAFGAGTASVRFICGTFTPHETLEHTIAKFLGVEAAYTFVSCWNATEAVFPTLAEPGDAIISDALNHACIIDSVRLATTIHKGIHKFVYPNNDMNALREALTGARAAIDDDHALWVVTDGVFSMEGSLANLPAMRALCSEFGAVLVVDDSHGTGVMGRTGRGTHEHHAMTGADIDLFTGTLGKALGGGAGGYIAGPKFAIDLIVQRARPTLFSNALPVTVACSANKAIEVLDREPKRVQKLRDNAAYARKHIRAAGFEVLDSPTAICAIIVGDTARAIAMSKRLLELSVYVIGFGYPVVPEGTARLRIQLSAAHELAHIDSLVGALKKL